MALGLLQWAYQQRTPSQTISDLKSWKTTDLLVAEVKKALAEVADKKAGAGGQAQPSVIVLGALGRCGNGAVWFAEQCGIKATKWDMEETKKGGPFPELLKASVHACVVILMLLCVSSTCW